MELFTWAFENNLSSLQQNLDSLIIKDQKGKTLLHYAVLGSAMDVIDFLLNQDIDVNIKDQNGESAIFDAARKGKLLVVKKLVAKYARVDLTNRKKETILHLACHKGDVDLVKFLVENQASLIAKTEEDKLPLHYAILAGHFNLIPYLIEMSKISYDYKDAQSNSFLHYAAKTTNHSLIQYFIDLNLDVNALNDHFETPLFNAVRNGTKQTVLTLLNNDAYINIKNRRFESVYDIAKIHEYKEIVELINEYKESVRYLNLIENDALIIAVLNRDHNELRILLDKGYRLKKDRLRKTALDYANLYKLNVCVNLLRPYSL